MKTTKLFFLLATIIFASCSAANKSASMDNYRDQTSVSFSEMEKDKSTVEEKTTIERKIIYNASLTLEVDSSQNAKAKILALTKEYNGFMVQTSTNMVSVRVPAVHLENALTRFKNIGKLISESQSSQDVTDAYFDIQLRLDNAEKSRKRYIELLEKAQTVEEILKVERELERLNADIESFKGKIKSFDTQVDFSLITVYLQPKAEKVKPGPLGYIFVGLYKGVKWLFVRE